MKLFILFLVGLSSTAMALEGGVSVTDFGARGDGVSDDTTAFQDALNAVADVGGWVYVPPVHAGAGYVLTHTVYIPEGVSLIGMPAGAGSNVRAVFTVPDRNVKGSKIFARPGPDQYEGIHKAPLFQLSPGAAVRGFWILYDEQPMPSDEAFQNPDSEFYYPDFDTARKNFMNDHVKPYGPTFYGEGVVNVVLEDIVCDRAVDFIYIASGGKCHFQRLTSFGYGRAFAIEKALDVMHIHNYEWVPNTGPLSPGGPFAAYDGEHFSWIYGIIASQHDNVGIHLGHVDGYSFSDITFFGIHTGIRFGYSDSYPMYNPVKGETATALPPGNGPWGDISGLKVDQCVIGCHFVWPTHLTNRVANALIFTGFDDGTPFESIEGDTDNVIARQAAFMVEPSHTRDNNTGFVSTFMATNTIIASFEDTRRFANASAHARIANGRAFLFNGDIFMELTGIQISPPYDIGHVWAAGTGAKRVLSRMRGYLLAFTPQPDFEITLSPDAEKIN